MNIANPSVLTARGIFKLVEQELALVEAETLQRSASSIDLITKINGYIHSSGGKRVRPALLLLTSKMCGYGGDSAVSLGSVVEMIHVATLVHDDIIDHASVRRGRPSVNAEWGNPITVLIGDWLYMTAFSVALELRDFRVLDILIDVTRRMIEGELMQLDRNGRLDISPDEQLDICLHKTAYLFAGCARLGGVLAGVDAQREKQLRDYGTALGMAFQLIDDVLDYTSSQQAMGKPVLKDLEEGRVTLPLTYVLEKARPSDREAVRRIVNEKIFTEENKQVILRLVQRYGAVEQVRNLAEDYARQACSCLAGFPDSVYRDALLRIPDFITNRDH